ncbi:PHO85 cyclin PHO80 [Nakaseomyces bracarensis]|uniref:PHO85 cyclin PHO80 n=1 Tax=Nakaseomyces bracarensis TaxID=273131 RepID=A0ABR4NT85_9SACH
MNQYDPTIGDTNMDEVYRMQEDRREQDLDDEEEVVTVELPRDFLQCPRAELVALIARMLAFLVEINDMSIQNIQETHELTRFHSKVPPNISIFNYFARLTKYSTLEHSVLLAAVYYIDLLSNVYPAFNLNSLTAHRFILTATTVASKGLCDSFCTNSHYAKVGGVQCNELNVLETEFLKKVNYRILPRDHNISFCKLEIQRNYFILPEVLEMELNPTLRQNYSTLPNAGYNVLTRYYFKIIQLVGNFNRSPDKTKRVNYVLTPYSNTNSFASSTIVNTNVSNSTTNTDNKTDITTTTNTTTTNTTTNNDNNNILNINNDPYSNNSLTGSKRNYEYVRNQADVSGPYETGSLTFNVNVDGEISTPYKKLITEHRKVHNKNVFSKSL